MRQSAVEFEIDGDKLEGVLSTPLNPRPPFPGAVVCHGHPLFGGSMDSLLTYAICEALAENGIAALRFNFRPFGQGATEEGGTACRDVAAGLHLLRNWPEVRRGRCGMIGYSAGAAAILRGLGSLKRAKAFSLVSPPLAAVSSTPIGDDKRQRQFVIGADDRIVDPAKLEAAIEAMKRPPELQVIPGADHTMRRNPRRVAAAVALFSGSKLRPQPQAKPSDFPPRTTLYSKDHIRRIPPERSTSRPNLTPRTHCSTTPHLKYRPAPDRKRPDSPAGVGRSSWTPWRG